MNSIPNSFYEGILQGLAGDVTGRRALFLFIVDHSEAIRRPFGRSSQSRLDMVTELLNEMVTEMARVDQGPEGHFDLGFIAYNVQNCGSGIDTMWANLPQETGGFIQEVRQVSTIGTDRYIVSKPPASNGNGYLQRAMDATAKAINFWSQRNPNPIYKPVVIHVVSGDQPASPDLSSVVNRLNDEVAPFLFHCCLVDECPNSVVFPSATGVSAGLCQQLYDCSSEMPPLMVDIGQLLKGHVTPRLRQSAAALARSHGLPGWLGSAGADLLGSMMGGRGLSLPTERIGWIQQVHVSIKGLTIDSSRGFALVKDRVGFQIFTKLCN